MEFLWQFKITILLEFLAAALVIAMSGLGSSSNTLARIAQHSWNLIVALVPPVWGIEAVCAAVENTEQIASPLYTLALDITSGSCTLVTGLVIGILFRSGEAAGLSVHSFDRWARVRYRVIGGAVLLDYFHIAILQYGRLPELMERLRSRVEVLELLERTSP